MVFSEFGGPVLLPLNAGATVDDLKACLFRLLDDFSPFTRCSAGPVVTCDLAGLGLRVFRRDRPCAGDQGLLV